MRGLTLLFIFPAWGLYAQELLVSVLNDSDIAICSDGETCVDFIQGENGGLSGPRRLLWGRDERVYAVSGNRDEVLRYDADGRFVDVFIEDGSGGLDGLADLALGPDGHWYAASSGTHSIPRFNGESGSFLDTFVAAESGGLQNPRALAFGPAGRLHVLSGANGNILSFDGGSGAYLGELLPAGSVQDPRWFDFGPDEFLYVTDFETSQVLRFDPKSGQLWDVFAQQGLLRPEGACFAGDGKLYVASFSNNQVRAYTPDGLLDASFFVPGGPVAVLCPPSQKWEPRARFVYPWVSNNEGFESILVAHNYSSVAAQVTLTARRAQGPAEVVTHIIPPGGFLKEQASQLFPILGNGAGYTVNLEASLPEIGGVWVTNNLTAASGRSPSQGVAVQIPMNPGQKSVRSGNHISFGFLPTTGGLTSAPVVVNLGEESTDVTLRFFDEDGNLLLEDEESLRDLPPLRPFAAVANSLLPAGSGDVFAIASSEGQPVTGVSFVFNGGGEPAIGNVTLVEQSFTPQGQKAAWLETNLVPMNSHDPEDEDFSDLQPLKAKLDGVRVLMLGEQTHGDGATFLAKTRLIKFLHQEMGFDVLAFESGLYDCHKAWQAYQAGVTPLQAFSQSVFAIWSQSAQVVPIVNYLAEALAKGTPLELAGFDSQFNGTAASTSFVADLGSYLDGIGSTLTSDAGWEHFQAMVLSVTQNRFFIDGPPPVDQQEFFFSFLGVLQGIVNGNAGAEPDREDLFWAQMLESFEVHVRRSWQMDFDNFLNNPTVLRNLRDIQMGRNLVWQANSFFPGRKIIVWAATFHIARNLPTRILNIYTGAPFYDRELVTMGDVVWDALGTESYAMGFTAYQGTAGNVFGNSFELDLPDGKDLEALLNGAGFDTSFLDFRAGAAGSGWLSQTMVSRPMGYGRFGADWTQVLDGMLFTRTMIPSTPRAGKIHNKFPAAPWAHWKAMVPMEALKPKR